MGQSGIRSIEVVPTGASLGAEIVGLDLSREVDNEVFQRVYEAWNDYLVLRFRDQHLDDDMLVAFSRRFGELDMAPIPAAEERLAPTRP
jgi:taurine dioxygenase